MVNPDIIEAVHYSEIAKNTKIINYNELNYKVYVHLPEHISENIQLFKVEEILDKENINKVEIDYSGAIVRQIGRPWIDILVDLLNKNPGQHIYKLSFVDRLEEIIIPLYISYIIQQDHPNQDYVYMR